MWLVLWLLLPQAQANYSQSGPAYSEEARLLWEDGRKKFGMGLDLEAAYSFQRLIDRYPGESGYLDAHLLLGLTRLRLGQSDKAISPLKYFVEAAGRSTEGHRARLSLGRALLNTRKFNEALLVAMEVRDRHRRAPLPTEVYLGSLLIQAWAQVGLNKDFRARVALTSFDKEAAAHGNRFSELRTENHRISIELQLRECARLPGKGRVPEGTTRVKIKERGSCLISAILIYKKAIEAGATHWIERSQKAIFLGFQDYEYVCRNPPNPPGKRTAIEIKRYQAELADVLIPECRETRRQAIGILESWKSKLPEAKVYHLDDLRRRIQIARPGQQPRPS